MAMFLKEKSSYFIWMIYIVAGFEEEILFRGYIQTRMSGLINSQLVISIINSLLFLLIHYPVRWVVSGMITIHVLSFTYIICLIVLHFFCDAVYKRTNCLWGVCSAPYNLQCGRCDDYNSIKVKYGEITTHLFR